MSNQRGRSSHRSLCTCVVVPRTRAIHPSHARFPGCGRRARGFMAHSKTCARGPRAAGPASARALSIAAGAGGGGRSSLERRSLPLVHTSGPATEITAADAGPPKRAPRSTARVAAADGKGRNKGPRHIPWPGVGRSRVLSGAGLRVGVWAVASAWGGGMRSSGATAR